MELIILCGRKQTQTRHLQIVHVFIGNVYSFILVATGLVRIAGFFIASVPEEMYVVDEFALQQLICSINFDYT